MNVYSGKNPYGLNQYIPKLESLRIEISLLNYGIKNDGSLKNIMNVIQNNINTYDILAGNTSINNNNVPILHYIHDHQPDFFDNVYMKDDGKFPYLHPGIPFIGTLMKGNENFYTVGFSNGSKKWVEYNARTLRNDIPYFYPNNSMFEELYGLGFQYLITK